MSVCIWGPVTHLQIEQNSSYPHSLAHFQAVGEEREAWWALVVGRQNLNVHCGDGAPGRMIRHTSAHRQQQFLLDNLLSRAEVPRPQQNEKYSLCMKPRGSILVWKCDCRRDRLWLPFSSVGSLSEAEWCCEWLL